MASQILSIQSSLFSTNNCGASFSTAIIITTCGGEVKQIIVKASGFAYDNIRTKHSKQEPGWFKEKMTDMKRNNPGNTL